MAKKKPAAKKPAKQPESKFRDRLKELRRVKASELIANPRNWRTHPAEQRSALRAILEEVGWAAAVIARELPDGFLEVIDGHLRRDIDPEEIVPVLVTDLTEEEATKLNLVIDPIGDMAGADVAKLREILDVVQFSSEDLAALAISLAEEHGVIVTTEDEADPGEAGGGAPVPETYQLVIDCKDQADQKSLSEEFERRGYECRVLTL